MLGKLLGRKTSKRPDIVVITDTTSVLAPHAMTIQNSWQPGWAQANLPHTLALAITYHEGKLASPLDAALGAHVANTGGLSMMAYQFDTATAMSGNAWHHGREYELAIKGAPEAVLAHCDLTESEREDTYKALVTMASRSHQVIAAAYGIVRAAPSKLSALPAKDKLTFAGLVSVGAAPHPKARQAVQTALKAGISVRMITGGHSETAFALGHQLDLVTAHSQVLDARKLQHMDAEATLKAAEQTLIFTHATPKDKRLIISLFEKQHKVATAGSDTADFPTFIKALIKN